MQARTRVKICGLTRLEDIHAAVQAGADAVGLVLYAKSARAVSLQQARLLRAAVPAFVNAVTLFVNAPEHEVQEAIDQLRPELLQFHGDESPQYCESFNHRYMRAFRVGAPGLDTPEGLLQACRRYQSASAWLFDSYSEGYGGSGRRLDPSLLRLVQEAGDSRPMVLSGGLLPDTVAAAIMATRPYAVDVSSGVEAAPGDKCPQKIRQFLAAVRGL
ncbi:phosphoribosylanthranilate isomerase [Pollutimonas bauzanensis]|uniref:N-(5'-phosphoribosyl)anthranilate isomerase n=1 Tax=Pollutimonas bauzanensis TaxID=658167 RepID=A0A1M5M2A9_9BURK|nr:phosphoribosylanthranilate isomerase [Pollutimonas bauzanensis]SHG71437.1 phosphoribosylanthranilate isomerase [Pollutimonas bauzanensis]